MRAVGDVCMVQCGVVSGLAGPGGVLFGSHPARDLCPVLCIFEVYVCEHVSVCVCVRVYMCACMCARACANVFICVFSRTFFAQAFFCTLCCHFGRDSEPVAACPELSSNPSDVGDPPPLTALPAAA